MSTLTWLKKSPSRGMAFTIHLTLSLLVFSSLVLVMVLYWFPGKLFFLDGGWQGLKLVAMVDLVLGPALTLILYKPGKPKLVLDMSLIAMLQVAALGYGFYTTHQQRTVALVYAERGFNTISAKDNFEGDEQLRQLSLEPQPIPKAQLLSLPLLMTPPPADGDYGQYLVDIFNGYPGPQRRSDLYVPLAQHHDVMKGDALDTGYLEENGVLRKVEQSLAKRSKALEDVEIYPFRARYADGVALFDPVDKQILDYVPFNIKPSPVRTAALDEG